MKQIGLVLALLVSSFSLKAQNTTDSVKYTSITKFFRDGKVSGRARTYFMATDNDGNLTDYHGLGIGAGIGYKTPVYKGFSAGMSGFFIANISSSNFAELDPTTQNPNRYELGLFDITDPSNKGELDRLEELWVKYQKKGLSVTYGQVVPDNLFINGQDGRMSPTLTRGVWTELKHKKNKLSLFYITAISPRSTVTWYSVEESMGIYPMGRTTNGKAGNYAKNVSTSGIFGAEVNTITNKQFTTKIGSLTVPSVFQVYYLQPEWKKKGWIVKGLGVYQHSLGNGGNDDPAKRYIDVNEKSLVISGLVGKKFNKNQVNLNYTRITSSGRFLMPREWGREPFFTFMPRERNEGLGDVNAISVNYLRSFGKQIKLNTSYGKFFVADETDSRLNKYGLPSYNQLNIQIDYVFRNWLEGMDVKLLFVRKDKIKNNVTNDKFIFNKVDMGLVNFIVNYSF